MDYDKLQKHVDDICGEGHVACCVKKSRDVVFDFGEDQISIDAFRRSQVDIEAGRTRPVKDVIAELKAKADKTQELIREYEEAAVKNPSCKDVIEADIESLKKDVRRLSDLIAERDESSGETGQREAT